MSVRRLTVTIDAPDAVFDTYGLGATMLLTAAADRAAALKRFVDNEVVLGTYPVTLATQLDETDSTSGTLDVQTIACTQAEAAANTVTIAGVTLTEADTPANENEFTDGADDDATATNLAACIEAHSILSELFAAAAVTDTVTVTALSPAAFPDITTDDATAFDITHGTTGVVAVAATPVRAQTSDTLRSPT